MPGCFGILLHRKGDPASLKSGSLGKLIPGFDKSGKIQESLFTFMTEKFTLVYRQIKKIVLQKTFSQEMKPPFLRHVIPGSQETLW
jgi:hypothetical protein